ncbi:transglutaminase-like domain-containing protein [Solicola sp. PLA-1-18]|uniref:transglutaminase-like domain-containing protein n=1 Tax=Solicola sp. PLA-1-18 TaxID=3380532 RepID=UPI003B7C9739
MNRTVGAQLDVTVQATSELEMQVAVARVPGIEVDERLTVTLDGAPLAVREVATPHGGRMHLVDAEAGRLEVRYEATVTGRGDAPEPAGDDLSVYRRPSRYAASDTLGGFAVKQFGPVSDADLLTAVSSWVGTRLDYVPGSSGPTDGATDTLLAGAGVCRDYTHLVVALLRSLGVPARLVAVYAPGCDPMDFHAVAEAYLGGGWYAVDATALAPRSTLVRIATGRDAADTAFLTNNGGAIVLDRSVVTAVAEDGLPDDDLDELVTLG